MATPCYPMALPDRDSENQKAGYRLSMSLILHIDRRSIVSQRFLGGIQTAEYDGADGLLSWFRRKSTFG